MNRIFTSIAAMLLLVCANNVYAQEYVIKMKTAHAVGEWMGFSIQSNNNPVEIIGAEYVNGDFKVTAQEIELRGKITRLDCSSNWLESIDVSGNPLLVELYCDNNRLTDIKLGNQPNMTELYVGDNQLSTIDLSGLPALTSLSCYKNNLTTLDLSKNKELLELVCRENSLSGTLDLSANSKLQKVACYNNAITSIKLAPNNCVGKMEIERNNINGENMTNLVKSLPEFKEIEGYTDWYGMDPQAFYPFEYATDLEKNVFTSSDLAILKAKNWPVYAVDDVNVFDDLKEVDETMTGISQVSETGNTQTSAFDLSGRVVPVSDMRHGLYIIRRGNKTEKIMVK